MRFGCVELAQQVFGKKGRSMGEQWHKRIGTTMGTTSEEEEGWVVEVFYFHSQFRPCMYTRVPGWHLTCHVTKFVNVTYSD